MSDFIRLEGSGEGKATTAGAKIDVLPHCIILGFQGVNDCNIWICYPFMASGTMAFKYLSTILALLGCEMLLLVAPR